MEAIASGLAWASDRYQLKELVGSGGMSQVYRAWDRQLDREVAIKVLHPHLAASPDSRRRFSREARAVAKLHHPHILEIFDFSGDGDAAYIVTEFIRGTTLKQFSEQVGFGLPQIAALAAHSLCLALEHAHAGGIVHRDLKPENVMLADDGVLKLMDFGIARFLDQGEKMTMTGAMVGSPAYMAPEIIEGKDAGPRSDLFSLGTLLYWLLTGQLPFDAPNTPALLRKVVDVDYQDPRLVNGAISDSLAGVVRSLLARDPAARPESAEAVRVAIAAALAEDGISDPEASLRAFLSDPPGFRSRFRAQLLARLHKEATRALNEGRSVAALKLADRIMALEPDDAEAHRLVGAISAIQRRRKRWTRALYGCAAVSALAGAVAGLRALEAGRPRPGPAQALAAPQFEETPPAAPEIAPANSSAMSTSPAAAAPPALAMPTLARGSQDVPTHLRVVPRVKPVKVAPAPPVAVHFVVSPFATVLVDDHPATIFVHGEPQTGERPMGDIMIPQGHHRLTFAAAAYYPLTEELEIGPSSPTIRHYLHPLPAKLKVRSEPPDASVIVDDHPRGSAADSLNKPILLPLEKAEQRALVRVFKPGYADWTKEIGLRANEEIDLSPKLQSQGAR